MAAEILKCGASRVRVVQSKDVDEALTRQDIRNLIRKGLIYKVQKKGTSKINSRRRFKQKKKGRMGGAGRRKGTLKTRAPPKKEWMRIVRTLRKTLRELRASGQIADGSYGGIYRRIKGGSFRNKSHMFLYLKEHGLMKTRGEFKKTKGK